METAAISEANEIMKKFESQPLKDGENSTTMRTTFVTKALTNLRKLGSKCYGDLETEAWLGVMLCKESNTRAAAVDAEAIVTRLYNVQQAKKANDAGNIYYDARVSVLDEQTLVWKVDVEDGLVVVGDDIAELK